MFVRMEVLGAHFGRPALARNLKSLVIHPPSGYKVESEQEAALASRGDNVAETNNNDHPGHGPASGPGIGSGLGAGDIGFLILLILALVAVVLSARFTYREGTLFETAKGNAQTFMKWAEAVSVPDSKAEPFTLALCASAPGEVPPELASKVAPEGAAGLPVASKEPAEATSGAASAASTPGVLAAGGHGAPHGSSPVGAPSAAHEAVAAKQAPKEAGTEASTETVPDAPKVATTWATCREALFTAGGPLSRLSNPFDAVIPVAANKCERRNRSTRGVVYIQKGTPPPPGVPGGTSWSPIEDDEPMVRGLLLRVQACDAGGYTINIGEVKL